MPLQSLFTESRNSAPAFERTPAGFHEPTYRHAVPPHAVGSMRLSDPLPEFTITPSSPLVAIATHEAGKRVPLNTAIMENSRVCQAGARLVQVDPAAEAIPLGDSVAWQRRESRMTIISGAQLAVVPDGSNVTISGLPIKSAVIALGDSASHGICFEIPRSFIKRDGDAYYESIIATSLAIGIASLADRLLLDAIKAATPTPFTLAAAAALGIRAGELAGIVGTGGLGGSFAPDGTLRLAGVSAELTDQTDISVIGSFARAGVAIENDVRLIVERRALDGTMVVTAWVNAHALVPDATAFFSVSA